MTKKAPEKARKRDANRANGIPNEHKHLFTDHEKRNNTHDSEDDTSSAANARKGQMSE